MNSAAASSNTSFLTLYFQHHSLPLFYQEWFKKGMFEKSDNGETGNELIFLVSNLMY